LKRPLRGTIFVGLAKVEEPSRFEGVYIVLMLRGAVFMPLFSFRAQNTFAFEEEMKGWMLDVA
jgi:hypothetical protein